MRLSTLRMLLCAVIALSCAAVTAVTVAPSLWGTGIATAVSRGVYEAALYVVAAACAFRARMYPQERVAWALLALAVTSWAAGDTYYTLALEHRSTIPFPSLADAGYLLLYPLSYVALLSLVRARVSRFAGFLWLDGAIVALVVAAACDEFVVPAVLRATGGGTAAIATNLAYPVADGLLLALMLTVSVVAGARVDLDWLLIASGLTLFTVADSTYFYEVALATYQPGGLLDLGWLLGLALIGFAALVPTRRTASAPASSWGTILVPSGCALVALALELYDHFVRVGTYPILMASAAITLAVGRLVVTYRDNRRLLRRSERAALLDPLTGLANRRALLYDLTCVLAQRPERDPHVVAIFDLDGFKAYNDTFGHLAGDALLARLSTRLHRGVAGSARVYRLGGDEFCLLGPATATEALELVARASEYLTESNDGFLVRPSYGAALLPDEAATPTDALRLADTRMYGQKSSLPSAVDQTRVALVAALHERDVHLADHVNDVSHLATAVARELGLRETAIEDVRATAQLHDLGKLAIPDGILLKPEPLSEDERRFVESHTLIGERILTTVPALRRIARYVRASHERWDGTGYPDGIAGDAIPLVARIVFVCDAYHAITSDRPYQRARSHEEALDELSRSAGTQFDPGVVAAFVRAASRSRAAHAGHG